MFGSVVQDHVQGHVPTAFQLGSGVGGPNYSSVEVLSQSPLGEC